MQQHKNLSNDSYFVADYYYYSSKDDVISVAQKLPLSGLALKSVNNITYTLFRIISKMRVCYLDLQLSTYKYNSK